MNGATPNEEATLLRGALGAFLQYGFHAVMLSELEAATGRPWADLCERFHDKEGLFLAAAEQGLADGSVAAEGKEAELHEMLDRLERVNGNPRLRAIHKQSLSKMRSLAEHRTTSDAG